MHWQLHRVAKLDGVAQATRIGSILQTRGRLEMAAALVTAFTQEIKSNSQLVSPPTILFCHGAGMHSTLHSYTLAALMFLSDNSFVYKLRFNPHIYHIVYIYYFSLLNVCDVHKLTIVYENCEDEIENEGGEKDPLVDALLYSYSGQ
jgi:hypothetical protein